MSIFSIENIQGKMYALLLDLKILDADAVPKIVKTLMVENKYAMLIKLLRVTSI